MSVFRRTKQILPAVAGLLAASASVALADQPLFTWTGTVDREVMVVMRGRNVETHGVDARLPNSARVANTIPRSGYGDVRVRLENGRGTVDVIEQPSARNGYQTVVRVRDPLGGSDRYRLVAYWTGDDNSSRNGGYDDRNGRNDRDDRNNGGYGNNGNSGNNRDDDRACNAGNGRGNANGRARNGNNGRGNDRNDDCYDRNDRNNGNNGGYGNNGGNNGGYGNNTNGPGTLQWSGRVDDVAEITIQGRRVDYVTRSGARVSNVRSDINGGALRDSRVTISGGSGRGLVQVVQQPSANNNYTAVIRITDNRSGAGDYDFQARW